MAVDKMLPALAKVLENAWHDERDVRSRYAMAADAMRKSQARIEALEAENAALREALVMTDRARLKLWLEIDTALDCARQARARQTEGEG